MIHVRTQIREALVGLLDNHPDLSGRVYEHPFVPGKDKMPAIIVAIGNESISRLTVHPDPDNELDRRVQVNIEVLANQAEPGVAKAAEALAAAVEQAVHTLDWSAYLGTLLSDELTLVAIDATPDKESNVPAYRLMLAYDGQYSTTQGNPEVAT